MANYDTFVFYAGTYPDVESAKQDYEAVKSLHYDMDLIDSFDAAIIENKEDGKVKVVKKHEQPTRHGGWVGAGWGLAAGFVMALFPAAAIGTGLLVGTTGAGAAIGAIAGHVKHGMKNKDLYELADMLDAGQVALIVAAASDIGKKVEEVMSRADKIEAREARIDLDDLTKDMEVAEKEASS